MSSLFGTGSGNQQPPPQQPPSNDPFDRIGSSTPSEGGVYPDPGNYPVLYVDVVKMIKTRKDENLFVAEFDILDSQVPTRPAGTKMSWVANLTKHDAAPGNVKLFIAAVMNVDKDQVTGEASREACSERNPCHGRLVALNATQVKTKQDKDFTKCIFSPLPDEYQQQAEQARQKAGFAPF